MQGFLIKVEAEAVMGAPSTESLKSSEALSLPTARRGARHFATFMLREFFLGGLLGMLNQHEKPNPK